MIKLFTLLSGLLILNSCISNPIKYYPPHRGQSPSQTQHREPTPAPTVKAAPVKQSEVIASTTPTVTPGILQTLPPPPVVAQPVEAPPKNAVELNKQKNLLDSVRNPMALKNRLTDIIDKETSLSVLDQALEISAAVPQSQQYRPYLFLRAGEVAQKSHKPDSALQYYRALLSQYPQSAQALKANSEIALLQAAQEVDAKVIGAVLPLSGKNANIGQHALNSIRIGLGLTKSDTKFRLAIFDSQGSAELARMGVEKLVRDDKVIAIIGGLSSKEALSAGQKADLLGVPFIGLSQKSGLTSIGDYVFRNSLTAEMQVDRLLQYAFEKLGAKKFAVLYPNDAYGVEFANIYWDHVLARGGQITAAQIYDPKENDFTTVIQKLVGTYHQDARSEELAERIKELEAEKKLRTADKTKPKVSSRAHEVQENVLPPIVDFDVLFIPDTGKSLGQVIAFMKVGDVTKLTYLGTNIWNSPDLGKRVGMQNNSAFFVDALDASDSKIRENAFFKDYLAEFNEEPTLIEMQVYETAQILRGLITNGSTTREALANNLRMLGRYSGVTGELRMSTQRELERPLHILSLDQGLIKKVE